MTLARLLCALLLCHHHLLRIHLHHQPRHLQRKVGASHLLPSGLWVHLPHGADVSAGQARGVRAGGVRGAGHLHRGRPRQDGLHVLHQRRGRRGSQLFHMEMKLKKIVNAILQANIRSHSAK